MKRAVFSQISDFINKSKTHSVLLIKGPRQVGKTYAVEAVLDNLKFPSIRMNLEKDIVLRNKIDETSDFNDFTFLLRNECGLKPNEQS